jgi:hypothetical protein
LWFFLWQYALKKLLFLTFSITGDKGRIFFCQELDRILWKEILCFYEITNYLSSQMLLVPNYDINRIILFTLRYVPIIELNCYQQTECLRSDVQNLFMMITKTRWDAQLQTLDIFGRSHPYGSNRSHYYNKHKRSICRL